MAQSLRLTAVEKTRLWPTPAFRGRVQLNGLDHFESWFLLEVVYFYEQTLEPRGLRQSLEKILADYPLLCGQLHLTRSGRLAVGYPGAGAVFSVCESGRTLHEVCAGLHDTFRVYDFIEKNNPLLLPLSNRPLATFRVTRFKGGGTALGISLAHAVTDGVSFYDFISNWSCVHEGLPVRLPLHDRSLLAAGSDAGSPAALPAACRGFRRLSSGQLLALYARFLAQQGATVCCALPFTAGQAAAIKNEAQKLGPVSLNDALAGHLWQVCSRINPAANPAAERRLLIPANVRPKLDHPDAGRYFGNAVAHVMLAAPQAELAAAGLAELAQRCRQQLAALDSAHLQEQLAWLAAVEQRGQLSRVYADIDPYAGDCMLSNLSRLPLYAARFDGCQPLRAEVPVIPIPWVLQVFASPADDGGILVYAHVPRPAAEKLKSGPWQDELYKYGEAQAPL